MENKGRQTTNPEKMKIVEETASLISNSNVLGMIDLEGLPSAALQDIKLKLHGKGTIKVIRKKLLKFALEKSKPELLEKVPDQPAILFTNENPFKVYKFIVSNKSACAAKAGQLAEDDIEVSAGPTDLMPGPAMTTLSSVKIKSKVDGGKIAILNDIIIVKKGEEISETVAGVLSMLKMKPMKIGMNVTHILEGDTTYPSEVLYIDDMETMTNISTAVQEAFNLSVEAGYVTRDNVEFIITKAFREAKEICLEANIITKDFIDDVLMKAVREGNVLKNLVPDAPAKEKVEEKTEVKEESAEVKDEKKEVSQDNDQEENKEENKV
jgi:large subunit ribosomal protein L10